jgi:hypothetical protein
MILRPLPPAAGVIVMVLALCTPALAASPTGGKTPDPPVAFPGPALPAAGLAGKVNVLHNRQDSYSVVLRSGVTYRLHLALAGDGCASLTIYAPTPQGFSAPAADHTGCSGYGLFTPGPGQGGTYSLLVTAPRGVRGAQRYHLQVGRALEDDIAPGRDISAVARIRGRLDGKRLDVVDLYCFEVTRRGEVRLRVEAPTELGLSIRDHNGTVVAGDDGSGHVRRTLPPGRYYAAVLAFANQQVRYTLTRIR